jgi:hypothetical protein
MRTPAGCSKKPDFSPAQPWRAETRLVPSKAAASEEARRTFRYVEPLSEARTKLVGFFSILLVQKLSIDNGRNREKQDRNCEHHPSDEGKRALENIPLGVPVEEGQKHQHGPKEAWQ